MTFRLGWIDDDRETERTAYGRFEWPDDPHETFVSSLGLWSKPEYEAQWRDGIGAVVHGAPCSVVVTSIEGERGVYTGSRWPIVLRGRDVEFRQQLVLPETVPGFGPDALAIDITPEAMPPNISRWAVPLADLVAFLG